MANGLDRLERFFTKRKPSAAAIGSCEPANPPAAPNTEPQFPSPSFIRPRTSRMAAREEVRVKHQSSRLSTLPDGQLPQRVPSLATQSSTSSTKSHQLSHTPTRSSSLSQSQRGSQIAIADHRDHQFPRSPTHNGYSPSTSAKSSSEHSSYRKAPSSPRKSSRLPPRLDTPPESESESEYEDRRRAFNFLNKKLPELPHGAPPTPSPSPELRLAPAPELRETKSIEILNQEVYEDIQRQLGEPFDEFPPLSRPLSPSSLSLSSSEVSLGSSTLREPDFTEFLNLSDDDIAESSIEPSILPYPEEVASIPSSYSPSIASRQAPSLLTLTPPCASRPATAAAFEAARIAKRYNFDLVYVVNLWPDQTRPQTSGPDHGDCASIASSFSARSSGMTGRLLAAYGLEKAKSPFQISSNVHKTILRSEGWIEYRNHLVRNDEFLRGYACAFYTGNYSRNDWARSSISSATLKSRADRGIVFAAYRMPRADGSYAGLNSDEGELADVYQDAETLVEMLIDIHVANRLRRPESISQQVDETGPMPGQQRMVTE